MISVYGIPVETLTAAIDVGLLAIAGGLAAAGVWWWMDR